MTAINPAWIRLCQEFRVLIRRYPEEKKTLFLSSLGLTSMRPNNSVLIDIVGPDALEIAIESMYRDISRRTKQSSRESLRIVATPTAYVGDQEQLEESQVYCGSEGDFTPEIVDQIRRYLAG